MQTHNLEQGSAEWLAHRARIFNASEAPAMMGASKYTTRAALLHAKATGITPDVSPATQALFDRGHAAEAAARPLIEDLIGDDLAPQVGTVEIDGMVLGASFDGITFMQDTVAEVKLWNEDLAAQVRAGILDMHYVWQLEQELLVSEADRVVFVCTDGTPERFVHMEYRPVPGRREQLLAGWRQFAADLATYTPPAAAEKIVAEPVEALPAVSVSVTGTLALADNFDAFERALRTFLADRLIREPQDDQDFADLGIQIKAMKKAEDALDAAEAQMLAQVETVDQAKRRKDTLKKLVRDNRLMAEKLLASEKERRKGELVAEGVTALRAHVAKLNERLGASLMPATATAADFGGAIKGLSSLDSMRDKISVLLAQAKIAASDVADKIEANVKALAAVAPEHAALFPDRSAIVLKAPEDCATLIRARVAEHDAAVKRRAEEAAERERARVRAEEEARAAAKVREELEAQEQARRAHALFQQREAMLDHVLGGTGMTQTTVDRDGTVEVKHIPTSEALAYPPAAPTQPLTTGPANVVPMPTKAPAATPPSLKLGAISERLGFTVTADFLARVGFQPAATDKAAKLYHEADFGRICEAIVAHIRAVQHQQQAA